MSRDRAVNRVNRKGARKSSHEPLLRAVQQDYYDRPPVIPTTNKDIKPLNAAQAHYDNAIRVSDITFGVGPAGTGKTWLAAMRAAEALMNKEIEKIVITRPAVAAGEELGFLPGELSEKYEPYFRPVKDAFIEYFGSGHTEYLIKVGRIEARPLGFLRGTTNKGAWLIADEMQNASPAQMKMLLTRIGQGSKFIINGDPTQCDLPASSGCGLTDAIKRVGHIRGVSITTFERGDIVRHGIIQDIIEAYENKPQANDNNPNADRYNRSTQSTDDAGLQRFLKG